MMKGHDSKAPTLTTLLDIMAALRDPENGCPWDREQNFNTIAPYTLEEAYEVVEAIEQEDVSALQDELGDLLFQVVFYAQMASENGWFDISGVITSICEKMIRRHPHVFADEVVEDAEAQSHAWERHKQKEKGVTNASVLDGVPVALPALTRALKLQKKAARVGFDWQDSQGLFEKVQEELEEFRHEYEKMADPGVLRGEAGDLLFAAVNLVRYAGLDPESALRQTNSKFIRRFHYVEAQCRAAGRDVTETGLETLDRYWDLAKQQE